MGRNGDQESKIPYWISALTTRTSLGCGIAEKRRMARPIRSTSVPDMRRAATLSFFDEHNSLEIHSLAGNDKGERVHAWVQLKSN